MSNDTTETSRTGVPNENGVETGPTTPGPSANDPVPPAPVTEPAASPPPDAAPEDEEVGAGSTLDDVKLAFRRNTGWIGKAGAAVQVLFHYFFVGCTSLLGLLIVLLIPVALAAAVALVLGLPGYLAYRWFGTPGEYVSTLTVIVTIFWSGYFVTHGWPRLSDWLVGVFTWLKPGLVWMGRVLENITDDDEDAPEPSGDESSAAAAE